MTIRGQRDGGIGLRTKRIALLGLLVALAMILSYLESLLPPFVAVPGIKLGLTNVVVLVALLTLDAGAAFGVNVVRIVLVGITFGNLSAMLYALAGGLLSFLGMFLLKKSRRFGPVGISTAGGVAHNFGQILVAMFVLETDKLIYYLPVLCISGTVAGVAVGILGGMVAKRITNKGGLS